jgi:hypothetical protein
MHQQFNPNGHPCQVLQTSHQLEWGDMSKTMTLGRAIAIAAESHAKQLRNEVCTLTFGFGYFYYLYQRKSLIHLRIVQEKVATNKDKVICNQFYVEPKPTKDLKAGLPPSGLEQWSNR